MTQESVKQVNMMNGTPREKEKILIIKTGWSEILHDERESRKASLGDVLRTTAILNLFKDDEVTWLTDKKAKPLLESNPYIKELRVLDAQAIDPIILEELKYRYYDAVINLEKDPGICALVRQIDAWKKFGFRLDPRSGEVKSFERSIGILMLSAQEDAKRQNKKTAQELLFEAVGAKWNGEEYILGYKPTTSETCDVGLNVIVGAKWPSKAWSMKNWDELENLLDKRGIKVSRQDKQPPEVLNDLHRYMDWLNSCKIVVSNDSLGLHVGIALKKKVLGLFGSTSPHEIHFYSRGKAIIPSIDRNCMPCFNSECKYDKSCIDHITPEQIADEIERLLK